MEETIERIVGFLRHAAQGVEERKQIMYLLGPWCIKRLDSFNGDKFVEMFKAPIKMLHPLLTATQEGNLVTIRNEFSIRLSVS
jgi:predicted Ser/Thr protein kinase